MGKSRLLAEFLRRADAPAVLKITCGQYLRATPYLAVRPTLRTLAGIDVDADPAVAGERLTSWVHDVAPDLTPWLPLLAIPFDANVTPTPESDRIAPEFRRARLQRALLDLLGGVIPAASVLVVEDAHWLDDATHALVVDIAGSVREHSWLIVSSRRPGLPVFPPSADATQLELQPLGAAAAGALASTLAEDHHGLAPRDIAELAERAGGNPMFVIELVAAAAAQGSTDALPDSIDQLLTSRIDTLAPPDRLLLRDASVMGAVVDTLVLAEAVDDQSVRDIARWDPLEPFVAPDDGMTLRFRHALFRTAAYEGLSYRRRALVHAAVGAVIERHASELRGVAGLLSLHFDVAGDHATRVALLGPRRARTRAPSTRTSRRPSSSGARCAMQTVPGSRPTDVAGVAEALGDVSELLGRYDEADVAYARARKNTDEPVAVVRLLYLQGMLREKRGRYSDAARWLGRALTRAAESEDVVDQSENRIEIAIGYSGINYRQGRYAECIKWARRAAADAHRSNDRRALAHALDLVDLALISYPEAGRDHEPGAALAIAEEVGDLVRQTSVLTNLALAAHQAGRWDEAAVLNRRSRAVADQAGDVNSAATALCNLGEVLCDQGRVEEAREVLLEARRIWRASRVPARSRGHEPVPRAHRAARRGCAASARVARCRP